MCTFFGFKLNFHTLRDVGPKIFHMCNQDDVQQEGSHFLLDAIGLLDKGKMSRCMLKSLQFDLFSPLKQQQ